MVLAIAVSESDKREIAANISGGAEMIVYENTAFGGNSLTITGNINNLKDENFNDRISSVLVKEGTFTLYQHQDFGGYSVTVSSRGGLLNLGFYINSDMLGGRNDAFSSIRFDSNLPPQADAQLSSNILNSIVALPA